MTADHAAMPAPIDPAAQPDATIDLAAGNVPCGLLSFDDHGRLLSVNRFLRELLGMPAHRMVPDTFEELLTPASRALHLPEVFERLRRGGVVEELYLTMCTCDGSELPMLVNVTRVTGDGGHCVAAVMQVRDRGRLEDELQRVRRAADQVPGLVYQYLRRPDGSASFPFASESIRDLFGVSSAEARESALGVRDRVLSEDWPVLEESIADSARTLRRWDHRFRVVLNGDVRWIEGRATPQALPDGATLWHGYLCDVSDRRALEQTLHDKSIAEQASRAKSELLARVSHELRTPLNAVLGFAQLLSHDEALRLRPQQQRQLAHIESAGRSLLGLINEVLDLTHIESGRMEVHIEPIDVSPVVTEALAMVELMAAQAGIALGHRVSAGLRVKADRSRLLQCLINLLTNAVKYNRIGGDVTLIAVSTAQGEARIDVRDTGQGLDATQVAQLFEPFNRLGAEHGDIEGSGLGLVITRGLAERLGGRLTVDSTPGRGTCFSLFLPRAEWVVEQPMSSAPEAPPPLRRPDDTLTGRVLYVEDNSVNVVLMQAIFDLRPGLQLRVAGTGAEAIAMASADPPDLLLLDVGLPDMDGLTLLKRLRDAPSLRAVPAVAVSADALGPDIERALQAGFTGYWTKPLDLRKTLEGLDELLAAPHG